MAGPTPMGGDKRFESFQEGAMDAQPPSAISCQQETVLKGDC
jgi:hypothetical protein